MCGSCFCCSSIDSPCWWHSMQLCGRHRYDKLFSGDGCNVDPSITVFGTEKRCVTPDMLWPFDAFSSSWCLKGNSFGPSGCFRVLLYSSQEYHLCFPERWERIRERSRKRERAYYSNEQMKAKSEPHSPRVQSLALLWWLMSGSLSFNGNLLNTARWHQSGLGPLQSQQNALDHVSSTQEVRFVVQRPVSSQSAVPKTRDDALKGLCIIPKHNRGLIWLLLLLLSLLLPNNKHDVHATAWATQAASS